MLPRRVWNDSEASPEGSPALHPQRPGAEVEAAEGAGDRRIAVGNQPRLRAGLRQCDRRIDGPERAQSRESVARSIERDDEDGDNVNQRGDHRSAERDHQDIDHAPLEIHRQLSLTMLGMAPFSMAPAVALTGESAKAKRQSEAILRPDGQPIAGMRAGGNSDVETAIGAA